MITKQHKWYNEAVAYMEGGKLQYAYGAYLNDGLYWIEYIGHAFPDFNSWEVMWRMKLEPKLDIVEYANDCGTWIDGWYLSLVECIAGEENDCVNCIKRTTNGETGKITYEAVGD